MEAANARRKVKIAKLREQGWRCLYCTCRLTRKTATAEHRKPIARGGVDAPGNIDAACEPCNTAKGTLTKREFELAIFNPNLRRDTWPLYLACIDIRLKRRTELACRRLLSIIAAPAVRSEPASEPAP
jgi:5-methylcytosine-specific restriction endonuclease McrA